MIDAHQHFWQISRGDYVWLSPAAGNLYRDYLPLDLAPLLNVHAVSGTILVQAAPSEAETHFLLGLAAAHPFVAGVVGWVDFQSVNAPQRIAKMVAAGGGKLKGLRPMIQDIADPSWVAKPMLDSAFDAMIDHDLVFDALVRPAHLTALRERLLRHPGLRAVLDHAGKPDIARHAIEDWARNIEGLARESDIFCKLSGLLNEAGEHRTAKTLAPFAATIFRHFGANRVAWGSDWPVLNAVSDYAEWLAIAKSLVEDLAPGSVSEVFAGAAQRLYRLRPSRREPG